MKTNTRTTSRGKGRSRPGDTGQGGVFVMSIDRAKLIEQLLALVGNEEMMLQPRE
jgi:hypothetical protein